MWRVPVVGLASAAMLATLGAGALTANAADGVESTTFVPNTEAATYTLTVNANGGKFGNSTAYKTAVESAIDGDDDKVTFNDDKNPTVATIENVPAQLDTDDVRAIFAKNAVANTNRVMSGYYDGQQIGQGANVADPAGVTLTGDMTVYAHWYVDSEKVTVSYNGGTPDDVLLAPGDKLADWQLPSYEDPSSHQVSDYWTKDKVNGERVTTDTAFTEGTNLYPHLRNSIKVTYTKADIDSNAVVNKTQYVISGEAFAAPADAVTTPETGKVLAGWYKAKDGAATASTYDALESKPFDFAAGSTTDVTLFAKFDDSAPLATVTYYLNKKGEASVVYGTDTVYNNGLTSVNVPPTPSDPTDQGRPFLYWSTDNTNGESSSRYDFNTAVPATGLNLFAVWGAPTVSSKTAVFDPNYTGSNVIEVKANGDGSFTAPEVERDGYEFEGWYDSGDAEFNAEKTDYADKSVFRAKWSNPAEDALEAAYVKINDADSKFTEDSLDAYAKAYKAAQDKYGDTADEVKEADREAATEAMQAAQALLVTKDSSSVTSPVYRVYNKAENKHLYTMNAAEAQRLIAAGWRDEGISFYAVNDVTATMKKSGLYIQVHRLYDKPAARHLYTTDEAEYEKLVSEGWRDEGVAFYARTQGGSEVWRAYSPSRYEHLFTTNQAEYEAATTAQGEGWYRGENVAFNVEK